MTWYPIGESSYGDLRGQMQYVNSERIAQQWLSLVRDFWARFGVRLSPNEAKRSRARQSLLYAAYLRNGYPVAASPFTSRHDEVFHGNAIDAGVTLADGSNRALTAAEFAWLHEQCELRGFTWTGRNFGEPWHIEGATRPEHFPPYPGITVETAVLSTPAPKPTSTPVGDIMTSKLVALDNGRNGRDVALYNDDTMRCIVGLNPSAAAFHEATGVKWATKDTQARAILNGYDRVNGRGAN